MKRKTSRIAFQNDEKKLKDEKPDVGQFSEYEKMIQKNRDEKDAFFKSLKIDEAKEDLNEAIRSLKPKRAYIKRKFKNPMHGLTPQIPTRKSPRLAKVDIDLSEKATVARALVEVTKEIVKELPSSLTFDEAITGENTYANFLCDFEDLNFNTPKPFKNYRSCFKNMKIDESKIAQVVDDRITSMAFHPMTEKVIVSAGNRYGTIGFWHVNADSSPYEFKPHLAGIPCLKFNSEYPNQIVSCSYDGTMRCGDMEKKVFDEVFNISDETTCNYFDFISPTTILVCHRNGSANVVDIRSKSKAAQKTLKYHDYSVYMKTVSVHPVNKNYFVSGHTKGFLSLWDLRKLQNKPVIEKHHHQRVITSAFFSPVTGNSVLTTSNDNSLCLFDSSKLGSSLPLCKEVKHNNCTGSVSPFKATWLPNTDDAFVIGSLKYPRRIEIYNTKMNNIYNFQDEYLDVISSTNVFHPSLPVLAGVNSVGTVYVFS